MKRSLILVLSLLLLLAACASSTDQESGDASKEVLAKKELVGSWIGVSVLIDGEETPFEVINATTTLGMDFSHDRMVKLYTLTDGLPSAKNKAIFSYDETTGELTLQHEDQEIIGNVIDGFIYLDSVEGNIDPDTGRSNIQIKYKPVEEDE